MKKLHGWRGDPSPEVLDFSGLEIFDAQGVKYLIKSLVQFMTFRWR